MPEGTYNSASPYCPTGGSRTSGGCRNTWAALHEIVKQYGGSSSARDSRLEPSTLRFLTRLKQYYHTRQPEGSKSPTRNTRLLPSLCCLQVQRQFIVVVHTWPQLTKGPKTGSQNNPNIPYLFYRLSAVAGLTTRLGVYHLQ